MVETALVMGFLIFMVFSTLDLYFLSAAYSTYSQIAREGVLTTVRMDSLFIDSTTDDSLDSCSSAGVEKLDLQSSSPTYENCGPGGPTTCGHYLAQWRLKKAIDTVTSSRISNPSMKTTCRVSGTKSIEVELSANFTGFSPVFKNILIKVRQRGEMVS